MKSPGTIVLVSVGIVFVYIGTYGLFRKAHLYVHYTGSYKDGVRHSIHAGRAAPVVRFPASLLLYVHYPLKVGEEIYWNRDRIEPYFRSGMK